MRTDLDAVLARLRESDFRRRIKLGPAERTYLRVKKLPIVMEHARQFVTDRIAPAEPANDGKQTPMKGHPVFIAQHATATCCRKCLDEWHDISPGEPLTEAEIDYILAVIERWLQDWL